MEQNIEKDYLKWIAESDYPAGKKKTMQAAIELFAKQGYHGTSTAQISKAAGVSEATIFKYFKNKTTLLFDIVSPIAPVVFNEFFQELYTYTDLKCVISFFIHDRYQYLITNQMIIKIVFQEIMVNASFQVKMLQVIREAHLEEHLTQWFYQLKQANPQLIQTLDYIRFFRNLIAPITALFIQCHISHIPIPDIDAELMMIETQVYRALTLEY